MVEKSVKLSVKDIGVVRIVCRRCETAIELPLAMLENGGIRCPGCGEELRRAGVDKSFGELASSLRHLQRVDEIDVQFVLPVPLTF